MLKKGFRSAVLYCLFMSLLLVFFAIVGINQYQKSLSYKNQISELEENITQAKLHSDELKAESEYKESDEYLEKLARERLGMVKPNEIVYYDQNKK